MRIDEIMLNVDTTGYDEVYVIIKTHPSITQHKCPRGERLKEWVTEGQYNMYMCPGVHRECKINKVYEDKNNLYVIVRVEDEENQIYLYDLLNLNPRIPVVIVDGRKHDEKPVLFQGIQPTCELVNRFGDCVVTSYKIEDREFEDDYGDTTIRPTMIIEVKEGLACAL